MIVLVIVTSIASPNFLTPLSIRLQLQNFCLYTALIGVGQTLVILTGGIDLSVGALLAIASAFSTQLVTGSTPLALVVILPIALTTAIGAFSGAIIARTRIQPIVVTLAVAIAARGVAQLITGGAQVTLDPTASYGALATTFFSLALTNLGPAPLIGLIPVSVVLVAVIYLIAGLFLARTAIGKQIFAVGGNERAARLSGVPADRIKIAVYTVSGLLAGVAGVLFAAQANGTNPLLDGNLFELQTIAAVVVGGTSLLGGVGGVGRTLVGGLILVVLFALFIQIGLPTSAQLIAQGVIIAGAVFLQAGRG